MDETSNSLEDTFKSAYRLKNEVCSKKNDSPAATVVGFYGELGAGKTTFIQYFARTFNIKEPVLSPTFLIEKVYKIKRNPKFDTLVHIDAYRLEKPDELHSLGWEETLKNKKNLIVIEWAEKVEELLPENTIRVNLEFVDESKRRIKWQ